MYPRRGVTYSAFYSILMGKVCEILLAKIPHIKFIVLIYPEGGAWYSYISCLWVWSGNDITLRVGYHKSFPQQIKASQATFQLYRTIQQARLTIYMWWRTLDRRCVHKQLKVILLVTTSWRQPDAIVVQINKDEVTNSSIYLAKLGND